MSNRLCLTAARRAALLAFVVLSTAPTPTPARADLHFGQTAIEFGRVRTGPVLTGRFAFVNTGPETVEITDVRADCGCLKPRTSQHTCKPGDKGEVVLEVNTLSQPAGPHAWNVRLAYGAGDEPREISLQVRANLVAELKVQPAALTVLTDRGVSHEISVTDLRPRPLAVTAVRGSSPALKAVVADKGKDEEGHRVYRIRLEVTGDYPEGSGDEVLSIYTDDAYYGELRLPVTVVKRSPSRLAATPADVSLRAAPGQPVPSRVVLLRDNGDGPVVVDGVTADDPAVSCRWAQGPGNMVTLKVLVDGTRVRGGVLQTTVEVRVSKPAPQTVRIPVTCVIH